MSFLSVFGCFQIRGATSTENHPSTNYTVPSCSTACFNVKKRGLFFVLIQVQKNTCIIEPSSFLEKASANQLRLCTHLTT